MAVAASDIIEIEVLKWEEYQHHNGDRTYDWFKVSCNIFDDAEVSVLTDFQLAIWFKVLSVCAKHRSGRVKVTLKQLRRDPNVPLMYIERALFTFEQFQWVTLKSGTNRVPQKRIEENRREKKTTLSSPAPKAPPSPGLPIQNGHKQFPKEKGRTNPLWEAYSQAYKARYKNEPKRNQHTNNLLSRILDRLGLDDSVGVLKFYLTHNDRWYAGKYHSLDWCLRDAEKLFTEWKTGKKTNSIIARNTESDDHNLTVITNVMNKEREKERLEREVNERSILETSNGAGKNLPTQS